MSREDVWINWIIFGGDMPTIEFDPVNVEVEL